MSSGMQMITPLTADLLERAIATMRDPSLRTLTDSHGFRLAALNPEAIARAYVAPGRVLAAAGVVPHWFGRAEAWLLVTQECTRRELVAGLRFARGFLDGVQQDPRWRRVEIFVRQGAPTSFATALGFTEEARLRSFDPLGRDYALWSRIAEEAA